MSNMKAAGDGDGVVVGHSTGGVGLSRQVRAVGEEEVKYVVSSGGCGN